MAKEFYDDDPWQRGEAMFLAMRERLFGPEFRDEVLEFVTGQIGGNRPVKVSLPSRKRGFNLDYRVQYTDGRSVLAHFLLPGFFQMADEKIQAEVAALQYLAKSTAIPVPTVLRYGTDKESIGGLGPFIIMSYIEHSQSLASLLAKPDRIYGEYIPGVLAVMDPDISEQRLSFLYGQVADILLQLANCDFSKIGSLGVSDSKSLGDTPIASRPMSFGLAGFGQGSMVPRAKLPDKSQTFSSSSDYISFLADMHLQQLALISTYEIETSRTAEDCRKRYTARQLFRRVTSERRFASADVDLGPFKLWCDNLRPENILLDDQYHVVGVICWGFTYAAPAEFTYCPPWWLILSPPEDHLRGWESWVNDYECRLQTFLNALKDREKKQVRDGLLDETQILSTRMRHCWESGDFWLFYTVYRPWALDEVFWKFIDERFFGERKGGFEARLKLLSPEQIAEMEAFVKCKKRVQDARDGAKVIPRPADAEPPSAPMIMNVDSIPCEHTNGSFEIYLAFHQH